MSPLFKVLLEKWYIGALLRVLILDQKKVVKIKINIFKIYKPAQTVTMNIIFIIKIKS